MTAKTRKVLLVNGPRHGDRVDLPYETHEFRAAVVIETAIPSPPVAPASTMRVVTYKPVLTDGRFQFFDQVIIDQTGVTPFYLKGTSKWTR